jgi:hypothetical protein
VVQLELVRAEGEQLQRMLEFDQIEGGQAGVVDQAVVAVLVQRERSDQEFLVLAQRDPGLQVGFGADERAEFDPLLVGVLKIYGP